MLAEGMGKPKGPPNKTLVAHHDEKGDKASQEDKITLEDLDIQRLSWKTDNKIAEAIKKAEETIQKTVENSEGLMLWFDEYGANWMKRQGGSACPVWHNFALSHLLILDTKPLAKLSPDAYIQMAMQLAYRRLHGKGTPTYETASTRLFLHGRTETIRTYSEDSQRWVEATVAGNADVGAFVISRETLVLTIKLACGV